MSMSIWLLAVSAKAGTDPLPPPLPSEGQLYVQDLGLSQFMHFSVNPFSEHTQHNCVNGTGVDAPPCLPAALFNPTNLSTDQWVETAVAFGAKEICLTAHHEGGFALWDTAYTNYSVMHSPYGKDVVAQFVKSCAKHNVKPCYYFPPNANGWLMTHNASREEFERVQMGQMAELLTKYDPPPSRLWWDHYGDDGKGPCWEPGTPKIGPVRFSAAHTFFCSTHVAHSTTPALPSPPPPPRAVLYTIRIPCCARTARSLRIGSALSRSLESSHRRPCSALGRTASLGISILASQNIQFGYRVTRRMGREWAARLRIMRCQEALT